MRGWVGGSVSGSDMKVGASDRKVDGGSDMKVGGLVGRWVGHEGRWVGGLMGKWVGHDTLPRQSLPAGQEDGADW